MKKFIFSLFLMFTMILTYGQDIYTLTDTVNGAETVTFNLGSDVSIVVAEFTQLGGSTDGTATILGGITDTKAVPLNFVGGTLGIASPQDTLGSNLNSVHIYTGMIASWALTNAHYKYKDLAVAGTSGDTTKVEVWYYKTSRGDRITYYD